MHEIERNTGTPVDVMAVAEAWFPSVLPSVFLGELHRVVAKTTTAAEVPVVIADFGRQMERLVFEAPDDTWKVVQGFIHVLAAVDDLPSAMTLLEQARRYADPAISPRLLHAQAWLEGLRGSRVRARKLIRRALKLARARGDGDCIRLCIVDGAQLLRESGLINEARHFLEQWDSIGGVEHEEEGHRDICARYHFEQAAVARRSFVGCGNTPSVARVLEYGSQVSKRVEVQLRTSLARLLADNGAIERARIVLEPIDDEDFPPGGPAWLADVKLAHVVIHRAAGDLARASREVDAARVIAETAGDRLRLWTVRLTDAELSYRRGELSRVRRAFAELGRQAIQAERYGDAEEARFRHALVLRAMGSIRRARSVFLKAHRRLERQGHAEGASRALLEAAITEHSCGRDDEASRRLVSCLDDRRDRGDRLGVARVLGALATIRRDQGDHGGALELFAESSELYRAAGNHYGYAVVLNDEAMVHRFRGDHDRALELYAESLRIKRSLGDRWGEALSLHDMASTLKEQGDLTEALAAVVEGTRIAHSMGAGLLSVRLGINRAHLSACRGDIVGASEELNMLVRTIRQTGCLADEPKALGALAEIYRSRGRFAAALRLLGRCEKLAAKRDDHRQLAWVLLQRAHVEADRNNVLAALELLGRCGDMRRRAGEMRGVAEVLWREGLLVLRSGSAIAAREKFEVALATGKACCASNVVVLAELGLIELEMTMGDVPDAVVRLEDLVVRADECACSEGLFWAFRLLGSIAWEDGDVAGALRYDGRALEIMASGVWAGGRPAALDDIVARCGRLMEHLDHSYGSSDAPPSCTFPAGKASVLFVALLGVGARVVRERVATFLALDRASVPLVLANGGTVIRQLADSVVASFPDEDSARRSGDMVRKRLEETGLPDAVIPDVVILAGCKSPLNRSEEDVLVARLRSMATSGSDIDSER